MLLQRVSTRCRFPLCILCVGAILSVVAVFLAGCGNTQGGDTQTVTVFAAASLTESYQVLAEEFEAANPGVEVVLNFASSHQLARQLAQGAPADVFASANIKQMQAAVEAGRVVSETQRVFAHNRLVAVVSTKSDIAVEGLQDLTKPGLKLILAAQEVPVGGYTQLFLEKTSTADEGSSLGADYREQVLQNVVSYEQTVKAVFTKVSLGEGDAGIVYSSDVTPEDRDMVTQITIPDALNTIATYPIAPIADADAPELAQTFIEYVLADEGQTVLEQHGFLPARTLP